MQTQPNDSFHPMQKLEIPSQNTAGIAFVLRNGARALVKWYKPEGDETYEDVQQSRDVDYALMEDWLRERIRDIHRPLQRRDMKPGWSFCFKSEYDCESEPLRYVQSENGRFFIQGSEEYLYPSALHMDLEVVKVLDENGIPVEDRG